MTTPATANTPATPGAPATVTTATPELDPSLAGNDPAKNEPEVAAPLTLEDPPEPETPEPDATVEVVYEPTGETGLDLALKFVGQRGFGPDHPGIVAAQKGDFKPLEEALKRLGDKAKGYQPYLKVAQESYERNAAVKQAEATKLQEAVVAAAGGVKEWNAIQAWAKANAEDSEKREINAALAAGPTVAGDMVKRLAEAYRMSGKSTNKPPSGLKEDASPGVPTSGALSPDAYKLALRELTAKVGANRVGSTPEFKELTQRRQAYKG